MGNAIAESALDRLRGSSYSALREVACTCRDGRLELRGVLPNQYLKQVAQALVAGVEGVTTVVNQIEVAPQRLHQVHEIGRGV